MNVPGRRMLLATLFSALTLPAAPSHAVWCVTSGPVCDTATVLTDVGTGGGGVLCEYAKSSGESSVPYFFTQTQAWGDANPHEWDIRVCVPLCVITNPASTSLSECLPT